MPYHNKSPPISLRLIPSGIELKHHVIHACHTKNSYQHLASLLQDSTTSTTPSPLKNILLTKRSLLTARPFCPFASRGVSCHISRTFSSTMLQCRSNAFTRANSFRLLRREIRIWVWLRTAVWRRESGPLVNSCVSSSESSYSVNSFRGLDCSSL